MINSLPDNKEKENKKRYISELKNSKRKGVDELLAWLDKTDFYQAPASTKFHLDVYGGLCQHSLNVLDITRKFNKVLELDIEDEPIIVVSLLHDLCKINYYIVKQVWDKEYKDQTNKWRQTDEWSVEEKMPLGHGEKSAILAYHYLDMNADEIAAIRWHLGAFEGGIQFAYPTGIPFKKATDKYPLLKLLMLADIAAVFKESLTKEKKNEVPNSKQLNINN